MHWPERMLSRKGPNVPANAAKPRLCGVGIFVSAHSVTVARYAALI